jgi:predicted ATP-dependent serine protease
MGMLLFLPGLGEQRDFACFAFTEVLSAVAKSGVKIVQIDTQQSLCQLDRAPTGIFGFDDLSGGGLPTARPTLICGDPGSGKTLFALSFLYYGATKYNEPGVFVSFEERPDELINNVRSLNFRLDELIPRISSARSYPSR